MEDGAEAFMLFLLVLGSRVLTVLLDLDEVNVTLENAEIFGSNLWVGAVWGRWIC